MKFMKLEDLMPGDLISIDTEFLYNNYRSQASILKNREMSIYKIEKSERYNYITIYFQSGHIEVFKDEVKDDYPIKIIALGKDE